MDEKSGKIAEFLSKGFGASLFLAIVVGSLTFFAHNFLKFYQDAGSQATAKAANDHDIDDLRLRIASLEMAIRNCRAARD